MTATEREGQDGSLSGTGGLPDGSVFAQLLGEAFADSVVREATLASWGLCEEHAFGLLIAVVRDERLSYPTAVLYVELLERALAAMTAGGPLAGLQVRRKLKTTGICPMCRPGVAEHAGRSGSPGGGDEATTGPLRDLLRRSQGYWRPLACPRCLGIHEGTLCREHLRAALPFASLADARAGLGNIARKLIAYSRSFRDGGSSGPTVEERAGLVAAIGWCAGWRELATVISSDEP